MDTDIVRRLETWYRGCCNQRWEHEHGIVIDTLDNPGWSVTIDLVGTPLAAAQFAEVKDLEPEEDWIRCVVRDQQFVGHGGPRMLGRVLEVFLDWASETTMRP